ncbi:MAG TPA: proline racemase family protein [Anaerolineae bacterium]|nr:proline racemase family protein [Anaerolineae bacterium]
MARTSATGSTSTVIRTYAATDRASAERSFLRERQQAAARGWEPKSRRWRSEGREHVLTVVFESSSDNAASLSSDPGVASQIAAITRRPLPWSPAQARERESSRLVVETLDLHCAGEPLRLIRSGYPAVPHLPIGERRSWVREQADHLRRMLMYEPRGHRDMYGAVLLPPHRGDADVAVLFMHNAGYSTMCGHGIIALTQGLIEQGLYPATTPTTEIRWETPAGLVTATAEVSVGVGAEPVVRSVRFLNVPSYLHAERLLMRPRGVRLFGAAAERKGLSVQLAFGGAYYGIVDVAELGMRVVPEQVEQLTRAGAAITDALRRDHTPAHPTDPSLGFVYGTILVDSDPATSPDGLAADATIRNVTVFADAEVDRSPCGSGTSALLAARHALGASEVGDTIVNAGITGEAFNARVEGVTSMGEREAVITSVEGSGYVTGHQRFVLDERDRLGEGFLLR